MDTESFVRCVLAHTNANDDIVVLHMTTEMQEFDLQFKGNEKLSVQDFSKKVLLFMERNPGLVLKNVFEDSFSVCFIASKKQTKIRSNPFNSGW